MRDLKKIQKNFFKDLPSHFNLLYGTLIVLIFFFNEIITMGLLFHCALLGISMRQLCDLKSLQMDHNQQTFSGAQ